MSTSPHISSTLYFLLLLYESPIVIIIFIVRLAGYGKPSKAFWKLASLRCSSSFSARVIALPTCSFVILFFLVCGYFTIFSTIRERWMTRIYFPGTFNFIFKIFNYFFIFLYYCYLQSLNQGYFIFDDILKLFFSYSIW